MSTNDRPATPARLVILLEDLDFGGTQRYALNLVSQLDRATFTPEIWLMRNGTTLLGNSPPAGVPIHCLTRGPKAGPASVLALARQLRKERPPLLYTLTAIPNIWGRLLGRLFGVRRIVSGYRSLLPDQWERLLWRLSDRIIANAEVLKTIMVSRHGVDPTRIVVIPNGVDTERFQPPGTPAGKALLLFAGRLVWEKDPLTLVRAFRQVRDRMPEATLVMSGEGPLKEDVMKCVSSLGLDEGVQQMPGTCDMRPLFQNARALVLPSVEEASPNVILEAMACGLPVVATRVGGIPELVEDGRTGLLVSARDVAGLAGAILSVLGDPIKARAMGAAGREKVSRDHALATMARATETALRQGPSASFIGG